MSIASMLVSYVLEKGSTLSAIFEKSFKLTRWPGTIAMKNTRPRSKISLEKDQPKRPLGQVLGFVGEHSCTSLCTMQVAAEPDAIADA